jgi:hypothetical protein
MTGATSFSYGVGDAEWHNVRLDDETAAIRMSPRHASLCLEVKAQSFWLWI